MVDATQFEKLELYRDPNNSDRFIARDPSDDAIYAIPFEEIESTDATITNNLTVDGTTTTDTLEAGQIDITDRIYQSGDALNTVGYFGVASPVDDVTSDTYTTAGTDIVGQFDPDRIPPGATLYGRTTGRLDGEDGETMQAAFRAYVEGGSDQTLDSIAVTREGSGNENVDSGWQEVTEPLSGVVWAISAETKITGGTGSISGTQLQAEFEWRID